MVMSAMESPSTGRAGGAAHIRMKDFSWEGGMRRCLAMALCLIAVLGFAGGALAQAPAVQEDTAPQSLLRTMQDMEFVASSVWT